MKGSMKEKKYEDGDFACQVCAGRANRGLPLFENRHDLSWVWWSNQSYGLAKIVHDGDCFNTFEATELRPAGAIIFTRNVDHDPFAAYLARKERVKE
jgi:hypothetical protein